MRAKGIIQRLLAIVIIAPIEVAGGTANAQQYPERTITIIHNYGPGTASDATARTIAEALSQQLGKSVVVDNKSGASGVIGTKFVASSTPDGYTLMVGPMTSLTAQPHLVLNTGLRPTASSPSATSQPISLASPSEATARWSTRSA